MGSGFVQLPSECVLAVGGAFLRVWKRGKGLIAEVPAGVVIDRTSGQVRFLGSEAAVVEGKLDPGLQLVRPFFAHHIIDRSLLSLLLREVFSQARQHGMSWQDLLSLRVLISPATSSLHSQWLLQTVKEAGAWLAQSEDELAVFLKRKKRSPEIVSLVLDCGFSASRAALFSSGEILSSAMNPEMGIAALSRALAERERRENGRVFSVSDFFDLQWSTEHVAFDERQDRPISVIPEEKLVTETLADFCHGVERLLTEVLQETSGEVRAQLQKSEILVLGGGAELFSRMPQLKNFPYPIHPAKNSVYASLQAAGEL